MVIRLPKKARTSPEIRREIQASDLPATELAKIYGVHRHTIGKWRNRDTVEDASHRPHRLHATLTPAQEAIVVCLCETLLLPLDDLLAVTRQFICPELSRSALDRCLHRHGVSNLKTPIAAKEGEDSPSMAKKGFKDYEPGFVHIDVKYLPITDRFCVTGERAPTGNHLYVLYCCSNTTHISTNSIFLLWL